MAKSRFITDQPDKLDYASPTQFKFEIHNYITSSFRVRFFYFCATKTPTLGRDIPIHGSKVEFEEFTMSFMVDEYLENYISLHNWMTGIGFPKERKQFGRAIGS